MRVAVIGVGSIGRYLIDGIQAGHAGAARVVGMAGRPGAEARLASLASSIGCRWTTDALELLGEKPADSTTFIGCAPQRAGARVTRAPRRLTADVCEQAPCE